MAALEDEIEVLSQLDEYRVQSAKRRDEVLANGFLRRIQFHL